MPMRDEMISLSNDLLRRIVKFDESWSDFDDESLSDKDIVTLSANLRHLSEGLTSLADQLDGFATARRLDA